MARATAMIKATIDQIDSRSGYIGSPHLNHNLVEDLQAGRFIGMTFMLADAAASTLQVVRPANSLLCTLMARSGRALCDVQTRPPLGISPDMILSAAVTTPLRPGDCWLLFSDGIPEARNRAEEEFTLPRSFVNSLPLGQTGGCNPGYGGFAPGKNSYGPRPNMMTRRCCCWTGGARRPRLSLARCVRPKNLAAGREFVEKWASSPATMT